MNNCNNDYYFLETKYFSINQLERSRSRSRLPLKYNVHVPHAHVHVRDRVELKIGITSKLNKLYTFNLNLISITKSIMKYHNFSITCNVQTHYN